MKPFAVHILLGCLLLSSGAAVAAEANSLAEMMQKARYSQGFEARMNVLVTKANGAHPAPMKLAVIGQSSADKQRLLIRGIAPASARKQFFAAERSGNGRIRVLKYRDQTAYAELDPATRILDSGLVAWDMLTPWWYWPLQSIEGSEQIDGRECTWIRSATDDKNSAVQEVESCVDRQAKLALKIRLFSSQHKLLRTLSVGKLMRQADSGNMAAKSLTITDATGIRTELEVYAGDEQYLVSAETFSVLDRPIAIEQQGSNK